ncbi:Serine carboxypeptidase 1 [Linum perenne]
MAAKSSRWFPLMISVFVIILRKAEAAPADSLVTSLPGFNGTFPSRHYSGYVSLKKEKNMFYYMIESERNPKDDPVVLWLNGGPGCSSFDGFVYEHGPFNFEQGKVKGSLPKLHLNPFSWSKVSNMIYLDSPCGVGLSYSPNASNYETDDHQTALDSHEFLLKWFQVYPEFQQNPFYISGESYAGIYVPTLSAQVVQGIKGAANPTINFKGYLVGNGVSNDEKTDGLGAFVHFVHGMALISDQMFQGAEAACNADFSGDTQNCSNTIHKISRAVSKLNIYDILEPCYHDPEGQMEKQPKLPTSFQQLGNTERPLKVRKRMFGRAWPLWREHFTNFRGNSSTSNNMPLWPQLARKAGGVMCVNDEVATAWLNDETVRKALHAQPISTAGSWELCSDRISYGFGSGSMVPIHKNLTTQGYRALIYSGDHDMCVPYTGTEAWTSSLGYNVIDEWRPWISGDDNQVAGYLEGYEHNLTFLTIKGAGHTVPEYKPRESLDFFTRFLDAKPI